MIFTELYSGGGLGNQLFWYVVTRIIAENNGYDFGYTGKENFKGKDILNLDFGKPVLKNFEYTRYSERMIRDENGIDITPADVDMLRVPDNTKISGIMQCMFYIKDHKEKISKWLKIKPEKVNTKYSADDMCVMHLRAGDYIGCSANSLLRPEYYKNAMKFMKQRNPDMKFYLVSDDKRMAQIYSQELGVEMIGSLLEDEPDPYRASHHLGGRIDIDYAILNSAKNVIISNSTFAFWPVWTNPNNPCVISPKFWFAHNLDINRWSTGDMKVREWNYLDKEGRVNYDCV